MLAQLGYKVLTASSGDAAIEFIDSDVPIDLLFTDVVMPGKVKSVELAQRAAARSPAVPTLFTSGYTRDEIVHHGKLDAGITLLSKPYRRDDLARKVRGVLRAGAAAPAGVVLVRVRRRRTDRRLRAARRVRPWQRVQAGKPALRYRGCIPKEGPVGDGALARHAGSRAAGRRRRGFTRSIQ